MIQDSHNIIPGDWRNESDLGLTSHEIYLEIGIQMNRHIHAQISWNTLTMKGMLHAARFCKRL